MAEDSRARLERLRALTQSPGGDVTAAATEASKARNAAFFAFVKKLSESQGDVGAAEAPARRVPKWPPGSPG
jgi:hypothetical protein